MTPSIRKTRNDVRIAKDNMIRVDGIPVGKVIIIDGVCILQFCDGDRMRSSCRGSRLVEVTLEDFLAVVKGC